MTAAEVYLPCDVGHVRVKLGFGDTLSPLEETALQVIAAQSPVPASSSGGSPAPPEAATRPGADIYTVATLLGLGYRVVLDLVHDLWRAGYLVVDFHANTIELTQDVKDKLANGQLAALKGTETEDCTVELMVERLTGHVMHSQGRAAPADPQLAIRFTGTDTGMPEASHAEIEQAVRGWLGRERYGRQRRIMSIRSAPEDRAVGARRRWYQLGVQADVNPDTDDLVITVIDRRFPAERRERAGDRLTRLAQERPLEQWVTQLRSAAELRLVTPPPVEEVIERLGGKIADGMAIPAGRRRAEHLEWADESRRIAGLIQDRIAHEAQAEPVIGGKAHAAVAGQLIEEARTQLVLTCPRIVDYVLEQFRPQLQEAIDRGVQVVILWGGEYKATLQGNVSRALESLARRAKTAPLLRAQVSANTDVRMVVCDNQAALVTSRDLLLTTRERPEVGLLLRSPDAQRSAGLLELLGWARVNMPGAMSTSVLRHADRFDATAAADQDQLPEPARRRLPEEPPEDITENGAIRAWVMGWEAHLAALRADLASRPLPALRIVEDGGHRELLWQALRRASRRVVIASGQISDEVINSRMIDAITMLLARGVAVTIGYDEQGGAERGKGALAALSDLAETYPALLTVHGGAGHSRALVWDDDVTVGSYSYLFHAGYGTVGGHHMLPSELSVRLTDPALADQIAAACGEPAALTGRVNGGAAAAAAPLPKIDEAVLGVTQRILNRAGDTHPGALVRTELGPAPDPWPVLDLLVRLGDPAVRRTAIAYCLAHANPDPPTAARWRPRLVLELVRGGMFTEAQILGAGTMKDQENHHTERGGASRPDSLHAVVGRDNVPQTVVLAALARRGQPGGDVLLEAAFADVLSADEQAALRAVSVRELLESGSADASDALDVLTSGDGAWGELASLAITYHGRVTGASTTELMREVGRQRRAGAWLGAAWERLELALIEAEPVPKILDGAKKTKAALFKDTGPLGQLRAMGVRRDLPALRTLMAAEFPGRAKATEVAENLLDGTWREVAPLSPLLEGRPRAKYVRRLAEVVSAARDLAVGDPATGPGEDDVALHPDLLTAASELAEGYERLRPALEDMPGAGPLVVAVTTDVLASLDRLMAGLPGDPVIEDPVDLDGDAPSQLTGIEEGAVPRWPGQWQYPELAAALAAGDDSPAHAAALLLRDLVDPLPPAQTARQLIAAGEFSAVENLHAKATLAAPEKSALLRELQAAQEVAGARAGYEAAALSRRARRTGLEAALDPEAVSEQAQSRRADADQALGRFRAEVNAAEDASAEGLMAAVRQHPAVLAGHDEGKRVAAEAVERWHRAVLACVVAREFASARHMLDQGPGEVYSYDPRIFAAPRSAWPFPADIPETVLSWYFADGPGTPSRFEGWRPAREDTAAWGVLDAFGAYLREPSTRSATVLRDKVQLLVGVNHGTGLMAARGAAWTGRLHLPSSNRLPRLSLLDRDGIALWVADASIPPAGLDESVVAWLVTDFGQLGEVPPGTMIIDLPFLFRLLAPGQMGTADAETRLVNLVRQFGAQLDARRLIEDAQPLFRPVNVTDVAWLLDLLGAGSDGVVADALHFDTGGRCEVLVPLLGELLPPPVPGRPRYHPLDVPMLNKAWDAGAWREAALRDLLAPLQGESDVLLAAHAIAWVAAAFHDGDFALEELASGIRIAATTANQAETFLRSADLGGGAGQVLRAGIFACPREERWQLPADGIRELLAGVWPGHDPVARARTAIDAWFRHHERTVAQMRAELSDDVVRTIGHWIANRMAAARSALERGDAERAWQIVIGIDSVHDMYREALDGEDVLPLGDVLNARRHETEFTNPGFRVKVSSAVELAGLFVVANRWLLGHGLQNLFDNARQAFEATGREFGNLHVTVTVTGSPVAAEHACRIDLEDDGTGLNAEVRDKFAAREEFSTRGGRGTGLQAARRWIEEYRGTVEVRDERSKLGGAWIQVTLPLSTVPARAPEC